MAKKKKSLISETQIERELSKINLELNKISINKPGPKEEAKKIFGKKEEEREEEEEEQENDFHENPLSRISRRFTVPILLPSGQEKIENLEEFAALAPSREREEKEDSGYAGSKKTYESNTPLSYSGKSDYSADEKYSASKDSLTADRGGKILSPFIKEDFTRGKLMNEVQPAAGMEAKTDLENRSRLEEFARMQAEYQINEQKELQEKKRRGHI